MVGLTTISLFQFHYGSIKGVFKVVNEQTKAGFNSTMVRLKAAKYNAFKFRNHVSIPLWFD